ncbi:MAG: hypothetical protein MR868_07280 [Lachnospiraceae bacterium]|nr:hypothetical protein [Lachnospiraceae bacterium]
MDVRESVKDKANYADIVAWFRSQGELDAGQLVLLVDTIGEMSEEIFEHYIALCNILKGELQRIRRLCAEKGCQEAFPDEAMRHQLAYVIGRACGERAILPEKYAELMDELNK